MFLAGCQSVEEQVGKKIAEGALGQMMGGDVQLDEKNGNMVIKTKDGEASVGGGDTRPASVPSDLPSLPNAKEFSWLGNNESGIFNYEIESADFKAACAQVYDGVKQAGWSKNENSFDLDSEDSMMSSWVKEGRIVTVICSNSEGKITISMSYGKDTSKADSENTDSEGISG